MSEDRTPVSSDHARIYPCARCGIMRSKAEGGTTFTVCDECWDALHPPQSTPEAEEAEIYAACARIDDTTLHVARMKPDDEALAAAREAGRLEGDAAGYRRGMEEAIRIIDALPRGFETVLTGTALDWQQPSLLPVRVRVPTVDEGAAAIRAKMEGK